MDVTWADILEDSTGHPNKLSPAVVVNTWRFYRWKTIILEGHAMRCGLFTSSKPDKDGEYNHAVVVPKSVILSIKPASRR